MTALKALRETLQEKILRFEPTVQRPVLKRARAAHALFETGAPMGLRAPEAVKTALLEDGFCVTGGAVWLIEPPASFYQRPAPLELPNCPQNPSLWSAYTLFRLIRSHISSGADTGAVRLLLKAAEAGQTEAACNEILRMQAAHLRRGEPLNGLLLPWLYDLVKGDEKNADPLL